MNLLLAVALASGMLFVREARGGNYGCGDVGVDAGYNFEVSQSRRFSGCAHASDAVEGNVISRVIS